MITNIKQYHIVIHCIMSITRDRFRPSWISLDRCRRYSITKMLNENKFAMGCKKNDALQHNMIQQYLHHDDHFEGHTYIHGIDNKSHQ